MFEKCMRQGISEVVGLSIGEENKMKKSKVKENKRPDGNWTLFSLRGNQ